MNRYNFNKNIKLHTVCANDDLRPVMECVHFKDGNALASNGHILIYADMKEISTFSDEDIAKLNGKYLHAKQFKEIVKRDFVIVEEDGITVKDDFYQLKFLFMKDLRYPNFDNILSDLDTNKKQRGVVLIDARRLNIVAGSIGENRTRLYMSEGSKAMKIEFPQKNSIGLIMPIMDDL